MDAIFEISTLKNPRVSNFIKINQKFQIKNFNFNQKFFGEKMFGPKF